MLFSTLIDNLLIRILRLGEKKFWVLFLSIPLAIVILINGIDRIPEEHYQRLSQDPFSIRTDIHPNNYWQETLTLPLLAHSLGMTSRVLFSILCFILILGIYVLFAVFTARKLNTGISLILSALLIASPMTTILFSWLGSPDGLTILLTIPFLFFSSNLVFFIISILGTANHPAFVVATLEILVLRWFIKDKVRVSHLAATSMGIITGFALIKWFLRFYNIEVASRLDFTISRTFAEWVELNFANLPITLFSLFNVQWILAAVCAIILTRMNRRFFTFAALFLVFNLILTFFTLDTTRVFNLLSWGIFFQCVFYSYELAGHEDDLGKEFNRILLVVATISLFAPRYFSWAGDIHTTPFYEFLRRFLE